MKQTVTSKYEPKSKNVTWIDMSTGHPVQKNFINGMWRPTGGGGNGAGSSNPTEADATKVWQVTPVQKGTKTEETVIVPEQTLIGDQELEYNDKFVLGAQCVAVIDGVEYKGEVEAVEGGGGYLFGTEFYEFTCNPSVGSFYFYNYSDSREVIAKLSVIEETPIYDYNWAPGVKIPIPTAEDEGKILVVNEVEVSSEEYELAPTQTVTIARGITALQNTSNLDKFVEGATVALVLNGTTYTEQVINDGGLVVEIDSGEPGYILGLFEADGETILGLTGNTGTYEVSVSVLAKEYSYEYQLQENSGGSSNVLWPAMYEYNGNEIMATFVPEDVESGTWCMVCGKINEDSIDTCLPVLIASYGSYTICNNTDNSLIVDTYSVDGGKLLRLSSAGGR